MNHHVYRRVLVPAADSAAQIAFDTLCDALRLTARGPSSFEGAAVPVSWGHPYGGVLLAQAYAAAAATVPDGRTVRSMPTSSRSDATTWLSTSR